MKSEDRAEYIVPGTFLTDDAIIRRALDILSERMKVIDGRKTISSPDDAKNYLILSAGRLDHEEFGVLWLDARGAMIADDRLFRGTLTQTSVYHREVVKAALAANAASAILYHNHPSGNDRPSDADQHLTLCLKDALGLVDVKVRDHIIVACSKTFSFAENGLI